ncbi:MAG: GtrA family protein [Lachnospiraceae bacterium]|nr:GtrA family protein [Lachnospiraceae bacterium]
MKKLMAQIIKFGIVGVVATVVDWCIYALLVKLYGVGPFAGLTDVMPERNWNLVATTISFSVSVIVNYIGSMMFVFERRDDMSRTKEFTIFMILSIMGLGLNILIIYVMDPVVKPLEDLFAPIAFIKSLIFMVPKVVATFLVLVWNFVTRKMFLEKKEDSVVAEN